MTLNRPFSNYTFTLTVTDSQGASSSSATHVAVAFEPNGTPTAVAGTNHTVTAAPGDTTATFMLDGTGSSDPNHSSTYKWEDVQLGVIGTTPTLSVTRGFGTHTFILTVTDSYGSSTSDSLSITVQPGNHTPVAVGGSDQNVTVAHDGNPATNTAPVMLNGSGSNDPDAGQILSYRWVDQSSAIVGNGSGHVESHPRILHVYINGYRSDRRKLFVSCARNRTSRT